jgi:GAF domain/PAS fold
VSFIALTHPDDRDRGRRGRDPSGLRNRNELQIKGNRRPMSQTVSRFAIEARGPLLIEHAEDDPRLNPQIRAKVGDRSHICVPLFAGEHPVGALSVMSTSEDDLDPEEHERVSVAVEELFAGESNSLRIETRLNRKDGSVVWVSASFSIVREPDGHPSFGIVMVQDETERKAAQDALVRQSEINEHQALHKSITASGIFASRSISSGSTSASRNSRNPSTPIRAPPRRPQALVSLRRCWTRVFSSATVQVQSSCSYPM